MDRSVVLCPQCGKQEARGFVHDREGVGISRHVNRMDETCPKCGSETVPHATERTPLAHHVAVAHAEYPLREEVALFQRAARTRAKNVVSMAAKKLRRVK